MLDLSVGRKEERKRKQQTYMLFPSYSKFQGIVVTGTAFVV
jgi:hypothetical protein